MIFPRIKKFSAYGLKEPLHITRCMAF